MIGKVAVRCLYGITKKKEPDSQSRSIQRRGLSTLLFIWFFVTRVHSTTNNYAEICGGASVTASSGSSGIGNIANNDMKSITSSTIATIR